MRSCIIGTIAFVCALAQPALLHGQELLVGPDEPLRRELLSPGQFAFDHRGFLECIGEADPGTVITHNGQTYESVAAFNNETLASMESISLDDKGVLEEALARFRAGLVEDPQFVSFLYNAARVARLLGEHESALHYINRALRAMPLLQSFWLEKGLIIEKLGQRHAAIAHLRRAQQVNPFDLRPTIALGDLYLRDGDLMRAQTYYERASGKIESQSNALVGLARIRMESGDHTQARRLLAPLTRRWPANGMPMRAVPVEAYYTMGLAAYHTHDFELAQSSFEIALSHPEDRFFLMMKRSEVETLLAESERNSR